MSCGYIYLVSFNDDSNNIYIGKTRCNVFYRLQQHKYHKNSSIKNYVNTYLNNDWTKVNIDIIDIIDTIDLTYIKHPYLLNNKSLNNHRLYLIESFHIHNFNNDKKYNLINKQIPTFIQKEYDLFVKKTSFYKNKK